MDITDEQWAILEPLFPEAERQRTTPKGGRPFKELRGVVDGVLWVLRTGAPWADLPARYPSYKTCHRRFQRWVQDGVLHGLLTGLAEDLRNRGKLDLTEAYIDGSHAGAKKGGLALESLDAAKRPRSWQWQTAMVFLSPPGLEVVSAMKRSSSSKRSRSASSKKPRNG